MKIHDIVQGSDNWKKFRLDHFGASEAAAMLGLSANVKRNELLRMKKHGTAKEFSDWVQVNILDHGHDVEAMARPHVEAFIGEELYPITCSDGKMSASCDGLTMCWSIAWEHKQWAEALAASVAAKVMPDTHMPQCQQILMATKAKKLIFTVSDGTPENMVQMEVVPDQAWFDRIRAGWAQFEVDMENYRHIEVLPVAIAAPVKDLPALSIRVDGALTLNHNLSMFGAKLDSFIADINIRPEDDQAFADAEAAIKVMERAEAALGAAEANALGQISTVDDMVRTVATYKELARKTRLMLEKMVNERKEKIRSEIQQGAKDKAIDHIAALNARIGKPYMPTVVSDFASAMKGKRTVSSLRDAADTELARFKIEANAIADKIQINLHTLRELAHAHTFLFADTAQICLKAGDDLTALVKLRIADHDRAEQSRAEALRAKIAEEERIKAEVAAAETARIAEENRSPAAELRNAQVNIVGADIMPTNAPDSPPTLRLGQIGERLGFSLTSDFLRTLGFEPSARDKAAMLYHESQFALICGALIERIQSVKIAQGSVSA